MDRGRTISGRGLRGGAGLKLLVALSALFSFVALAWMLLLPKYLEVCVQRETGFSCSVKVLMCNPFMGHVRVSGLSLDNPPSFESPGFVRVRSLEGDLSLMSYFTDQWVVEDLDVDVERLVIVTDAAGRSNASAFAAALNAGNAAGSPRRSWLVRRLRLRLGTLEIIDGPPGHGPARTYALGIDHRFTSVSNPSQLLIPSLLRSLGPAEAATGFSRWIPGGFGSTLSRELKTLSSGSMSVIRQLGTKAQRDAHDLFHALEQSLKP